MGLSEHSGAITIITASWRRQAEHGVTYPVYILARRALSSCGLDGWPLSNDQFCVRTDCTKPRIYGVFDSESMNTLNVLAVLTPRYASMAQTRSIYIYIDGQSRLWHRAAQPGTPRVTAVVSHMAPNTRIGWYFTHQGPWCTGPAGKSIPAQPDSHRGAAVTCQSCKAARRTVRTVCTVPTPRGDSGRKHTSPASS